MEEGLNNLWFNMYGRSYHTRKRQTEDSSAFEHIFVGESRDGDILGFHNWMRFYQLEKNGYIDYKGFYVSLFVSNISYRMKEKSIYNLNLSAAVIRRTVLRGQTL